MKKNLKRALAALFTVCLLCASFLPAFAAGTDGDPNVFESSGVYVDGDEKEHPFHTTVTFDPATGRLTIDEDKGNIHSIEKTEDLLNWIKTVASRVKTVYITKNSYLSHFTNDDGIAPYPFHHAFAYLSELERFEVEDGNTELTAKDGVLYSRYCLSLIHYPAAKTDKTYKIEESCMQGLEPYAICNTKYLERLEFPYTRSSLTFFDIEDYSLSAVDLETGEPRESSIRQIVYYGSEEELFYYNDFRGTNNVAHQAEIIYAQPTALQRFISYFSVTLVSYFRMMLNSFRLMFNALSER